MDFDTTYHSILLVSLVELELKKFFWELVSLLPVQPALEGGAERLLFYPLGFGLWGSTRSHLVFYAI